jgi:hypothetical protein
MKRDVAAPISRHSNYLPLRLRREIVGWPIYIGQASWQGSSKEQLGLTINRWRRLHLDIWGMQVIAAA